MRHLIFAFVTVFAAGSAAGMEGVSAREEVFEFAQPPQVVRQGDRIEIRFEAKGRCDATVAIENADGRIVRHLASGLLGENAPPPFTKGSLQQTLVWDGKDDRNVYIDDKDACTVRVSLGLRPRFERTLFHYPQRRQSRWPPIVCAQPEGVYVFDGGSGMDFLRLLDRNGDYVRTIYPFPAGKIAEVQGLEWHEHAGGAKLPVKPNFLQNGFLSSGSNAFNLKTYDAKEKRYDSIAGTTAHYGMEGVGASAMGVAQGRIALVHTFLNRLSSDGSSGGLPLLGPRTSFEIIGKGALNRDEKTPVQPRSAALAPDGKTLYFSGYVFAHAVGKASADIVTSENWDAFHAVMKLDITKDDPAVLFAGSQKLGESGSGAKQLDTPTCVATDAQGRVYVCDYMNDRVQVYRADGSLEKSIAHESPAWVRVHQKTGAVYVFTWSVAHARMERKEKNPPKPAVTVYSSLPQAKAATACPLPNSAMGSADFRYGTTFYQYFAELDSWSEPPAIWLVQDWKRDNVLTRQKPRQSGIEIYHLDGGKLKQTRSFEDDLVEAKVRPKAHADHRQRMYFNPKTERLLITEGDGFNGKSFKDAWEFNPETAAIQYVELPFDAEDMCFGQDGLAYLRSIDVVARFDPQDNWREVPFDYGDEQPHIHTSASSDRKSTSLIGGLPITANGGWHHGGMYVSPLGHLAVTCLYNSEGSKGHAVAINGAKGLREAAVYNVKKYEPRLYPGRGVGGRGGTPILHIWDKKGHLIHEDCLPGLSDNTYGLGLDGENNLYLLASGVRVRNGKAHHNDLSGTVLKVKPGEARIVRMSDKLPIPLQQAPSGQPDLAYGGKPNAWTEGVQWFFGGVGFCGKNRGVGCGCWNARMAFDYFHRTFAPEIDRYSVAVLDSAGNLILRVGRYGNADDGLPLIKEGGPPQARNLGGDEVALAHGAYLATHSDRRLFIADPGNGRILSVQLGYHAEARIKLAEVQDTPAAR